MVVGRINKFYKEVCLEEQEFVKDSDTTVGAFAKAHNGTIKAMYRFEVGEGMEKREENFAEEVMNQLK
jgi:elongation factor Ts